jgi:hypothetical protein
MTIARVVAVTVLCLLSVGAVAAQSAKDSAAAEKQITETLQQMYKAEERRDLNFIRAQMSDDFTEVAGDGKVYHWADIEAGFKDVVLQDYKLTDCIFKLTTRDSAWLTCRMDLHATYKGQPFPGSQRVTYLWTRQKKDWLLRFEQGTVITAPAGSKQ